MTPSAYIAIHLNGAMTLHFTREEAFAASGNGLIVPLYTHPCAP